MRRAIITKTAATRKSGTGTKRSRIAIINEQNWRWWYLSAMSGVLGLVVLDETVVGVALATIQPDLSMTLAGSHWVVNAYLLSFTCFVAVGGKLGDSVGHTSLFVFGAAILGAASLAAGLAPTGAWLICARAAQGIGAAIIFPAALATIMRIFAPEQRGTAFGIQVTIAACFMASGPLVGGFLTSVVSWRWIFLINLPAVAVIILIVLLASKRAEQVEATTATGSPLNAKIDYLGLTTLIGGLGAIVTAIMQGSEWGWATPTIITLFVGGTVLLVIFAVVELRIRNPLIDISLLSIPTFTGGNLVFFMFQFDKVAVFVFVALFLQNKLGHSAIGAGISVLVAVVPTLLTSFVAGKATDRFGSRRPLMVALLFNSLAVLGIGFAAFQESYGLMVGPLVVWGLSLPFIATSSRRALMSSIPQASQGQASGVNLTIQMMGGTVGMALCGSVLLVTKSYGALFVMTGVFLLLTIILVWLMVERDRPVKPA